MSIVISFSSSTSMDSSIFSPPVHSIYTIKHMYLTQFLLSHTHTHTLIYHHHIFIPFLYNLLLAGTLPRPLISLSLPHCHLHIFHFLVDTSCVHTVVLTQLFKNHSSTVSRHAPGFSPQKSSSTHLCHIPFQA